MSVIERVKRWITRMACRISNKPIVQFGCGLVAVFVVLPLLLRQFDVKFDTAIYLATGIVILWYTVETHGMRRQIVRQNEIAIQPLILTKIEWRQAAEGSRYEEQVILRNIGNGPALFVRIQDIQLHESKFGRLVVRFEATDVIEPKGEMVAEVHGWFDAQGQSHKTWTFVPALKPGTAKEDYEVVILYEDTGGHQRQSVMQMGRSGIRLLRHS